MNQLIKQKCVMIIAGEASGDIHGSNLVRAMHEKNKALFFCGIGGQALKHAGVRVLVDAEELAVVGVSEVFLKLPAIFKGLATAKQILKGLRPDLLILIDYPDFNLRIAATAKKLGIPVLYYISPQVWAWRSGRVNKIEKLINRMAVILPFEEEFYRKHNVPVTFVGHPLLDHNSAAHIIANRKNDGAHVVGLLPGSRDGEVSRHLPVMLDAASIITKQIKKIKFIISVAPSVKRKQIEDVIKKYNGTVDFEFVTKSVAEVCSQCSLVIAASGTVTLEVAITGTPMIIIYKMSSLSYRLGKIMISVKNIGLVNLIAGREIVPELLQSKASPENIADTAVAMLNDPSGLERMSNELHGIRDLLGGPGASKRVADIALGML
ncbi:MAG: lipid-A-disaccharide synthase [Deltaproteobacteria bacterium]|nr:lipid-A-disaccharide synthase [Deltaproteobacteria bacterium]MBW2660927.1 lipid-A-disaccharide synthase [Deltaproteobacteria bacterium]